MNPYFSNLCGDEIRRILDLENKIQECEMHKVEQCL
jgi:hypothetical protein